ncbi:ESX-1 secretion-associated protein [Mycobacterium hubeiense]|uniref:ESX-1 secretion-associated protein n=1 Tax=Mycobacterium hubeiense TaxID=1867256 RepID=UPI000C7F6757|nr:ESX-1 secretion-associated protein [Mycobacterium sp. QGD 101]
MSENLFVQTDGLRTFSQTHSNIASGISQLTGAVASGVETSHGPIASAVSTALNGLLGARDGTIQTTATSGSTLSELLQKAAQAYERGDQRSGDKLKAAADAMQGSPGTSTGGAPGATSAAGNPAAGGADSMGQMMGQVGQQVGQLGQSIAAPLAGMAQGLAQMPQTVMQGVQGIVQTATQAAGSGQAKDLGARVPDAGRPEAAGPGENAPRETSEKEQVKDQVSEQRDQAQPGENTREAAPVPPLQRAEPAQTRPQAD